MKKNLLFKMALFVIPVTGVLVLNSFSGGAPAGRTGSPGDGGITCTACHAPGANFGAMATITTTIPPEGYILGETYEVTVSATSSANAHGFQITAENAANSKVGTWTIIDAGTELAGGGTHVTHSTPNLSLPSGSWTVEWTAPNTNEGTITFYVAVNAVNLNGFNSGDQVVTTSDSHDINILGNEEVIFAGLSLYPNPAVESLNLELPSPVTEARVTVYSHTGQEMMRAEVNKTNPVLDVSHLQQGFYLLILQAEGKKTTRSFVKR